MLTLENIQAVFTTFEGMDLAKVMQYFADDAVLIDPHYQQSRMVGRAAIERGLRWGLGNMIKPGFTVRQIWLNGPTAAVEVDTHHLFKGGMELRFEQLFVIESREGKITRMQAYVPYGPPGVPGLLTRITRLVWRLKGDIHE